MKISFKETIWLDITFDTNSDNLVKDIENQNIDNAEDLCRYLDENNIEFISQYNLESSTPIYPPDNFMYSTCEMYNEEGELIYSNGIN